MKNICFIVNDFNFFYSHRYDLAKSLIEKYNYSVSVICSIGNASLEDIKICEENAIKVIHLRQRSEGGAVLKYLINLHRVLKHNQFEQLIFVTLELSFLGAILGILNRKHKRIFIISGIGHHYFLKTMKQRLLRKLEKIVFRISAARKSGNYFVFQNNDDLELFYNKGILKNYSHAVIFGNGIDTSKFSFSKRTGDEVTFCYSGRASKPKRIDTLIEAFKLLQEEFPSKKIFLKMFLLSGKNENDFDFLKDKNISVCYDLNQTNLITELHRCKVFVMPSEREGLPKAALEAASTGMPIIAANTTGTKETVQNNISGWIFEYANIKSLMNCMMHAIENSSKLEEIGKRSRNLVTEKFELNKIAAEYHNLLKS